jgi:lipid A 3-O-deacylase
MRLRQRFRFGRQLSSAVVAAAMLPPASAVAQEQRYLVLDEIKFGALAHDVAFAGGKEGGADINGEVLFALPAHMAAGLVPSFLSWLVRPRLDLGFEANTSGYTSQGYFGLTWTPLSVRDLVRPGDGLEFDASFGPAFNNGLIRSQRPDRKSLGSHVLFRISFELGYRLTPRYEVSAFFDHASNAGFSRENQSINDAGLRFGIRF